MKLSMKNHYRRLLEEDYWKNEIDFKNDIKFLQEQLFDIANHYSFLKDDNITYEDIVLLSKLLKEKSDETLKNVKTKTIEKIPVIRKIYWHFGGGSFPLMNTAYLSCIIVVKDIMEKFNLTEISPKHFDAIIENSEKTYPILNEYLTQKRKDNINKKSKGDENNFIDKEM